MAVNHGRPDISITSNSHPIKIGPCPLRQYSLLINGERRLAWTEWGDPSNPDLLLCVHGLTRSGRDFDRIAQALSDRFRVACIDVAGRGLSDPVPGDRYTLETYVADAACLLERLQPASLSWLGTSMGGLIGLAYTVAAPAGSPAIERLIINDVGPEVPRAALGRIAEYVGHHWKFPDMESAEAHIRRAYEPFRLRSDEDWRWFTRISVRHTDDGAYVPAYDPAISDQFAAAAASKPVENSWPIWDALTMPVLLLRGELSDVLTEPIAREMLARRPETDLHLIPGVGHAPPLLYENEIIPVRNWMIGN